jgi:hypothetical protein
MSMNRQIRLILLLAAALAGGTRAQTAEKPPMKTDTRSPETQSATSGSLQTATFALG